MMSENFNIGWQKAVDWICKESISRKMKHGYNPKGYQVTEQMRNLPSGQDGGFGEGLIYAIHKPIEVLKTKSTNKYK